MDERLVAEIEAIAVQTVTVSVNPIYSMTPRLKRRRLRRCVRCQQPILPGTGSRKYHKDCRKSAEERMNSLEVWQQERSDLQALGCLGCKYERDEKPNPDIPILSAKNRDEATTFPCGQCERNEAVADPYTTGDHHEYAFLD